MRQTYRTVFKPTLRLWKSRLLYKAARCRSLQPFRAGNEFSSEALEGALPKDQNSPQVCPYGLYAEQISGTSFTAPRRENQRSWLYKIRPSVCHDNFQEDIDCGPYISGSFSSDSARPDQLRWEPFSIPKLGEEYRTWVDFVDGMHTICGAGSPITRDGYAIHVYTFNKSMDKKCMSNSDGDFLILPQTGSLRFRTEMGILDVAPGELIVIQRGIKFQVELHSSGARGYILEVFSGHFTLPERGPIGANGLANPRDFLTPVAAFEDVEEPWDLVSKFGGKMFCASQGFSPFNVVAWHGNYAPYKYDLARFCPVNSVAYDHSDPSIFTVLTCPSAIPGTAVADFVIFPPRWTVAEHTYRPPYFHRNSMSEFMGLIRGDYDGKQGGFAPGGASLHSCMTPHGPDTKTFLAASTTKLKPQKIPDTTLAFMFEVYYLPTICEGAVYNKGVALRYAKVDWDYRKCWQGLESHFDGTVAGKTIQKPPSGTQLPAVDQEEGPA